VDRLHHHRCLDTQPQYPAQTKKEHCAERRAVPHEREWIGVGGVGTLALLARRRAVESLSFIIGTKAAGQQGSRAAGQQGSRNAGVRSTVSLCRCCDPASVVERAK